MGRNSVHKEKLRPGGQCDTLICADTEEISEASLHEGFDEDFFPDGAALFEVEQGFPENDEEPEDRGEPDISEDLVRAYFNSMGDLAVLTKNEEAALARKVEEGNAIIQEIVSSLPLYKKIEGETDHTGDDAASLALEMSLKVLEDSAQKPEATSEMKKKWEQITDARRSIELAKDELIIRNLRLVITVAKHYAGRGLPLLDLIQEGNIGLMKAVDRFKYEMGFKFSTYATWWIRQAITRAIMEQAKTIRVPVHIVEFHNRVAKATRDLTQELGREPGNREIAKKLGVSIKKVDEVCKAIRTPVAMETPVGSEDSVLGDFIGDRRTPLPDANVEKKEISKHLLKILKTLSYREEKVIRMRFGIGTDRDHTLEEVGRKLSITRERVRQIEVQAMRKLQHPSRMRILKELAAF